jgi:hypothetical protein
MWLIGHALGHWVAINESCSLPAAAGDAIRHDTYRDLDLYTGYSGALSLCERARHSSPLEQRGLLLQLIRWTRVQGRSGLVVLQPNGDRVSPFDLIYTGVDGRIVPWGLVTPDLEFEMSGAEVRVRPLASCRN